MIFLGEKDQRCPLAGLELPVSSASKIYEKASSADNFKVWLSLSLSLSSSSHSYRGFQLVAEAGIWHQMTPLMVKQTSEWFDQHFNPWWATYHQHPISHLLVRTFLICKISFRLQTALLSGLKTANCYFDKKQTSTKRLLTNRKGWKSLHVAIQDLKCEIYIHFDISYCVGKGRWNKFQIQEQEKNFGKSTLELKNPSLLPPFLGHGCKSCIHPGHGLVTSDVARTEKVAYANNSLESLIRNEKHIIRNAG